MRLASGGAGDAKRVVELLTDARRIHLRTTAVLLAPGVPNAVRGAVVLHTLSRASSHTEPEPA